MANSNKFLLLDPQNLLPSEFIPTLLGCVCDNPNQPWANYFPEDPSSFYSSTAAPFHIKARSTSVLLGRNTTGIARFLIEDLLSIEREKANKPTANWFGELSRVFNLPQEREVLSNMLDDVDLLSRRLPLSPSPVGGLRLSSPSIALEDPSTTQQLSRLRSRKSSQFPRQPKRLNGISSDTLRILS
ncbi:hypothetical protein FNYG_12842 [Fusarium nygamai]|uniref:Uncharacterized protein n=1 Tax=Gibberella nygamai TaxID=42673 RepID=A0A2K0VV50_GIBNY|nr:hypothetical protein FNYG_12842 [Fusarium nygamai]